MAAVWIPQITVIALFIASLGALGDATTVSISRSPSPEVPACGPMILTCVTTTLGPQMRVLVQRPTDIYPVANTFARLVSSGAYNVGILSGTSASVTIKEVTEHNMTSYTCVQYFDGDESAVSDTFHLVVPKPMSVSSLMKRTRRGMKVKVNWNIDTPMDIDSFNVLLSCGNSTHTWEDSRNNLDGATRETCFRLRSSYLKNCNATVKAIGGGFAVAMATTSVISDGEVISCGLFGFGQLLITSIILLLTVLLISVVICVCCKRQKKGKIVAVTKFKPHSTEKGSGYLRLNESYQVEDIKKVTPPPTYEQSKNGVVVAV